MLGNLLTIGALTQLPLDSSPGAKGGGWCGPSLPLADSAGPHGAVTSAAVGRGRELRAETALTRPVSTAW